jgi:hypothetical protein
MREALGYHTAGEEVWIANCVCVFIWNVAWPDALASGHGRGGMARCSGQNWPCQICMMATDDRADYGRSPIISGSRGSAWLRGNWRKQRGHKWPWPWPMYDSIVKPS